MPTVLVVVLALLGLNILLFLNLKFPAPGAATLRSLLALFGLRLVATRHVGTNVLGTIFERDPQEVVGLARALRTVSWTTHTLSRIQSS